MNIPWYVHSKNMANEKNVRKVVKNGRDSYYINIPKEIIKELKIKERQKVVVKRSGKKIIIEDWIK